MRFRRFIMFVLLSTLALLSVTAVLAEARAQGGTLQYGDSVSGRLDETQDRWTFSGSAGDTITISMESRDFDTLLELIGPDDVRAARNDDGGSGLNSLIEDFTLPISGTYTIIARGFELNARGAYTLSITQTASTPIATIEFGETAEGTLDANINLWTFSANSGDAVTIAMNSSDFDTYLELLGPDGEQIATNDDGGEGLNSLLENVSLPSTGTYTIVARGLSSSARGDYTLSLEVGVFEINPIRYGDTVTGTINRSTERWTFSGNAGDTVTIAMTSDDFDTFLELIGSDGQQVAFNDDGGEGLNSLIDQIVLPVTGDYTIIAGSYSNRGEGTYSLTLTSGGVSTPRPSPTPGASGSGTDIGYGQTVTGSLNETQELWTFSGTEGDIITIAMTSNDFDTYLELLGPNGQQLTVDDDGGQGLNSRIENFPLSTSGTFTIVARSFGNGGSGTYTLTLTEGDSGGSTSTGGGTITFGQSVTGTLNESRDQWTFNGNRGDVISIDMNSRDFDTYLELNGPDGQQVTRDDDGGEGLNSLINGFTLPTSGTYTIIARSFGDGGRGNYTLTLRTGGTVIPTSTPVPTPVTSNRGAITFGQSVTGSLNQSQEGWTFSGNRGDVVSIAMVSRDFDTYLELYGPDGQEVTRDDDGGEGLNSLINGVTLPTSGTYTIIARSFGNGGRGSYTLTLSMGGVIIPTPTPIPTPVTSNQGRIAYGDSVRGSLSESLDSWTFSGSAGDVITIAMDSSNFDTYLELYGPNGQEVTRNDDGGEGFNSLIEDFTLPSSGTYTIVARSFGNRGRGSYTLTLSSSGGSSGSTGGNTGGNTGGTSGGPGLGTTENSISFGQTVNATLNQAQDRWAFTGNAGQLVNITLDSSQFDAYLELYDPTGVRVAFNDDGGTQLNAYIEGFRLPTSGTYIIVARSFGNRGRGDYTLSLTGR